jgi:signal peptidase I
MSKTNLPPALSLMRKYLIVFFLPIAYILVLNLIGIIPPFYIFIVFLIAIIWRFAASSKRKWLSGFTAFLCFIPSLIVVRTFVQEFRYVNGTLMEPSLWDQDRVIVDKLIYRFSDPTRGDIIIFSDKLDDSLRIGRVVTLPDENIDAPIRISRDSYLVQVNYKDASNDTSFREVKKSEIIGRVKNRFWPINRIGLIPPEKTEALEVFKKFRRTQKGRD